MNVDTLLKQYFTDADIDSSFVVDFSGIDVVTNSFADGCIAKLQILEH